MGVAGRTRAPQRLQALGALCEERNGRESSTGSVVEMTGREGKEESSTDAACDTKADE